ncbi:MAG: hypothetical protein ACPGQL_09975 [Thermoplasmatota archaeon]
MEPAFEIGSVSQGAAWFLAGGLVFYAVLVALYAQNAFKVGLTDRWSAALAAVVLALLAALLGTRGAEILPAPVSVWAAAAMVAGLVFTLTFTLGRYQEDIDRFRQRFGDRLNALLEEALPEERLADLERLRERFQWGHEERRKAPHLLMGVFLVIYLAVGYLVVRAAWTLLYGGRPAEATGEGVINLDVLRSGDWMVAGHLVGVFCLLFILFFILPPELLRLRYPELSYPFKQIVLSRMRDREYGLFVAHTYISATLPLAVLWVTRDPANWHVTIPAVLGIFGVTVFADAASALFGKRWGKRKWPHNRDKSYVGTFAGAVVGFAVALPFVGAPMAIVSAAVFVAIDLAAPVPISITDNILNPLALAGAYWLLEGWLDPLVPFY